MKIDIKTFNQPLTPVLINVNGDEYNLSARFIEIDLPMQPVTNLDLTVGGSHLVEYFEGLLLIQIQERDAPVTVGHAIYAKYFESDDLGDDTVMLTDIVTDTHQDEITALFHNWCEKLTGTEPIIPDDLSAVAGVFFVTQ